MLGPAARTEILLGHIDEMLKALSLDLSPADRHGGWTPESQAAMQTFYQHMHTDVQAGKTVSLVPHYVSTVRGLDHWGVHAGPLFELAALISSCARTIQE